MGEFLIYLFEVVLTSAIFFLGYLLIKKHSLPNFRRIYLILWLLFSTLFPFVSLDSLKLDVPIFPSTTLESEVVDHWMPSDRDEAPSFEEVYSSSDFSDNQPGQIVEVENTPTISQGKVFLVSYFGISFLLLIRMFIGLFQILSMRMGAQVIYVDDRKVYKVSNTIKGASFFKWIFIGDVPENERNAVVKHEGLHSKLWHSLDVLLSHVYCSIFWINPFGWLMKRQLVINAELEVDQELSKEYDFATYSNMLLRLSTDFKPSIANHFSAKHLKIRIMSLKNTPRLKKWIFYVLPIILIFSLAVASCNKMEISQEARLKDVKTITTRFTSHQADTQQKTDKIVAIANFLPDGTLDEFVEQTTYPYDHEFDKKKEFWDQPDKVGIPYIMDGLSLGEAEKSILYGSDWPTSYAKFLENGKGKRDTRLPWLDEFEIDNMQQPTEIKHSRDYDQDREFFINMPDVTEFFTYEGGKITETAVQNVYPQIDPSSESYKAMQKALNKFLTEDQKRERIERMQDTEKKTTSLYTYNGDLLTNIVFGKMDDPSEYKFYYEDERLTKTEYYLRGKLVNTRMHFYENGLKQRTEILNMYNEPEYTITYSYEYW